MKTIYHVPFDVLNALFSEGGHSDGYIPLWFLLLVIFISASPILCFYCICITLGKKDKNKNDSSKQQEIKKNHQTNYNTVSEAVLRATQS